jgi:hypothetical protein
VLWIEPFLVVEYHPNFVLGPETSSTAAEIGKGIGNAATILLS